MALSPQWLDELRARTTLSAVVGRDVRLQKAGREFRACCPFHNEKTPSFYVNDEKGFYHCFGCEAHGDAIGWMIEQRGLPFMDAVKELASAAGMEVPAPDPRAARQAEARASLHDVTAAAQNWFVDNLQGPDGAAAREYLASRGVSQAVIREFGFGFAPPARQALSASLSGFEEQMLIDAGLRISVEGKDPYDRFRGRLTLPIQDRRGRIIGFGGRILDAEAHPQAPKYLNSPDTPLFDKGRNLYNEHRAALAARQSKRIVVVEGYMDVVALAQAGLGEAVAPMGTALTETQLERLWRHAERPILCFDGDGAGQRAALRAAMRALPFLRPGHSLGIARLPAGQDPDDLVRAEGRAGMEQVIESAQSLLDTLWQAEVDASPLASPEDKAGFKARLLAHVEAIQHPDIRALYRRELMDRFSAFAFPKRDWKAGSKARTTTVSTTLSSLAKSRLGTVGRQGGQELLAAAVFAGLRRHPGELDRHEEALLDLALRDKNASLWIDLLYDDAQALDLSSESPISADNGLPALPETSRFAFLDESSDPVDAREDLAEAVSLLVERPALEAALAATTARFDVDPEGSMAEQRALRDRLLLLDERLKQFGRRRAATAPSTSSATAPAQSDRTD